jgi:hypothetical protein
VDIRHVEVADLGGGTRRGNGGGCLGGRWAILVLVVDVRSRRASGSSPVHVVQS